MANKFDRPFFDSTYRFTDPIRVFKANDPYYWEVDNIPIQQLEENTKWIKDQIEGILGAEESTVEIPRSGFSDLKPYVTGSDNIVKVKAGKFSARINDAYTRTPLQLLEQIFGFYFTNLNIYDSKTLMSQLLLDILVNFKNASFPLSLNGLAERAFTFPMRDEDIPSEYMLSGEPSVSTGNLDYNVPYPNSYGNLWTALSNKTGTNTETFVGQFINPQLGFATGPIAESNFIKKWRGVTRTAIVNVSEELEIEIPPFDANDFYYIDETGTKVLLDANQRIDLVFIYSKPVDASATTISKYTGNTPLKITKPQLGIVKGAGLGVSFLKTNITSEVTKITDPDGNPIILAAPGDEQGENIGFGDIKGSFPSPDDLMNLAPLLSENLSDDNLALVGQSVLPVAYVLVRKAASTTSNNSIVIREADLIDIRPFFRTTELSYNERAGIAAATPQTSLANPVATEGLVDMKVRKVYEDYEAKINNVRSLINSDDNSKVVGVGAIKGGLYYGVEGTLAHYISQKFGVSETDFVRLKQEVESRYNYIGEGIPYYPDWDISEWCLRGNYTEKGAYPNDYINFNILGNKTPSNSAATIAHGFSCHTTKARDQRATRLGIDGTSYSEEFGPHNIYFVKKTIQLDRTPAADWMDDYFVNVQLLNCMPLATRANGGNNKVAAGGASVWVEKKRDEFTIYVSWAARDSLFRDNAGPGNEPSPTGGWMYPHQDRDAGRSFAGFAVINNDITSGHDFGAAIVDGESDSGIALYPTVVFEVVGIPRSLTSSAARPNYGLNRPTIVI